MCVTAIACVRSSVSMYVHMWACDCTSCSLHTVVVVVVVVHLGVLSCMCVSVHLVLDDRMDEVFLGHIEVNVLGSAGRVSPGR